MGDPDFTRIFCLVHAERLAYQVSDKVLQSLKKITQGKSGYFLVGDDIKLITIFLLRISFGYHLQQ